MQSSTSLSSISSTTSSNSSTYGSQTILELKDLPFAAPRCRSSMIEFLDNDQNLFSSPSRSMAKCRRIFRTGLSSLSYSTLQKQYFTKLSHQHRLLLVLNDYTCQCGCQFTMRQGSFVILYERRNEFTSLKNHRLVTVISNELICSKVPTEYVCDVQLLRERVRSRLFCNDDEQSFDL